MKKANLLCGTKRTKKQADINLISQNFLVAKKTGLNWNRTPGLCRLKHGAYINFEKKHKTTGTKPNKKNKQTDDSPKKHKKFSLQKRTDLIQSTSLCRLKLLLNFYARCARKNFLRS